MGPELLTAFSLRSRELMDVGRQLHARGWLPATSGNLSARLDPGHFAVTRSGRDKGRLAEGDFLAVDAEGTPLEAGQRPSAETPLHARLYRRFPEVGAVLHTHSVNATLLSRHAVAPLVFEDYELLKAFAGIETHATRLRVPVFANDQDVPRLAAAVDAHLAEQGPVHGYLIAGHGLYTWGRTVAEAARHLEAFEFLFECEVRMRGVRSP